MASVPAWDQHQYSETGESDADLMPWTKPLHNSSRVTVAGKVISGRRVPSEDLDMSNALDIAGNWRSSHGYPLHVVKTLLRSRAKNIDAGALVAQRLKRMPSIITKLQRFHSMQLSTMQDLGGCRAVLRSVSSVDRLVEIYEGNPTSAAVLVGKKDYITTPKPDGYRSVHLIYEYQGKSQGGAFCGQKVEIQIRSRLQHAWATALETIDTFTAEALKTGFGSDAWKRFFALVGTAMALSEKRTIVPDTPTDREELKKELKPLCKTLRVPDVFQAFAAGIQVATRPAVAGAVAHILILDAETKMVRVVSTSSNETAAEQYIELEKENLDKPHIQSVLVSVDSLQALRSAYPNFYLDTRRFTNFIERLTAK